MKVGCADVDGHNWPNFCLMKLSAYHKGRDGTGYGPEPDLPDVVEHQRPDYSLYPQFPGTSHGFLTRGCPRRCG